MKQETLEEVAERLYSDKLYPMYGSIRRDAFINGAKWQQERSEEDLKTAFLDGWQLRDGDLPFSKAMKKWFKQFKYE